MGQRRISGGAPRHGSRCGFGPAGENVSIHLPIHPCISTSTTCRSTSTVLDHHTYCIPIRGGFHAPLHLHSYYTNAIMHSFIEKMRCVYCLSMCSSIYPSIYPSQSLANQKKLKNLKNLYFLANQKNLFSRFPRWRNSSWVPCILTHAPRTRVGHRLAVLME